MLNNFTPRLYQQTILGTAANNHTLVVLPTGMGKSAIAFMLSAQRLHQYNGSKILLLAPTKPLCEQHVDTFRKHLTIDSNDVVLFTGSVKPEKRATLFQTAKIIISTPQGLENDIINNRINLKEISCLIFDEAHHATGEYAYVWIADQYEKQGKYTRILALTASPGSDLEKISEVCTNLHIERVEVRTEQDPDVKPYIQKVHKNWVYVEFPPEFKQVQTALKSSRKAKLIEAQGLGYCSDISANKTSLLKAQREMQRQISSGIRDYEILRSVSLYAEALKLDHGLELLESQGITQTHSYLKGIQEQSLTSKTKAVQNLVIDPNFKSALYLTEEIIKKGISHPKLPQLLDLIQETLTSNKEAKIMVFTQFRDSAECVVELLNNNNITNHIFVGQAKKKGLGFSQKQQKEILTNFRENRFSVLIATSVAEEGLDIPKVDSVIFFEPVPSAIRSIQRRGRTGRLEKGEVTILLTKGTRDEGYRWSAHHKEKRMYRNLNKLKTEFSFLKEKKQPTLQKYISKDQAVTVLADHREKDNKVVKELIDLGVSVKTSQLTCGDYILSGTAAVELKKVPDFIASIIDGRLLDQLRELKKHFSKSVVIVEGEEDMYSVRKVHANAIRGMLASIALGFNIPILHTKNPKDTAALLAVMAKREQDTSRTLALHDSKPQSHTRVQEYIISSLPTIGLGTSTKLLQHFKSVSAVMNATKGQLEEVEGIGPKTAATILNIIQKPYEK